VFVLRFLMLDQQRQLNALNASQRLLGAQKRSKQAAHVIGLPEEVPRVHGGASLSVMQSAQQYMGAFKRCLAFLQESMQCPTTECWTFASLLRHKERLKELLVLSSATQHAGAAAASGSAAPPASPPSSAAPPASPPTTLMLLSSSTAPGRISSVRGSRGVQGPPSIPSSSGSSAASPLLALRACAGSLDTYLDKLPPSRFLRNVLLPTNSDTPLRPPELQTLQRLWNDPRLRTKLPAASVVGALPYYPPAKVGRRRNDISAMNRRGRESLLHLDLGDPATFALENEGAREEEEWEQEEGEEDEEVEGMEVGLQPSGSQLASTLIMNSQPARGRGEAPSVSIGVQLGESGEEFSVWRRLQLTAPSASSPRRAVTGSAPQTSAPPPPKTSPQPQRTWAQYFGEMFG